METEGEAKIEGAKHLIIEGEAKIEGAARDKNGAGVWEPLPRKFVQN